MEYKVFIGNEEITEYTIIPLNEQTTLDESLDQGYLRLNYTDKESAYKPFTSVSVEIKDGYNNTRQLDYFIASDNKTEIIANGTYSHELLLIEQSKWFERFLTGTKTVTHPLIHDYMATQQDITYEHYGSNPSGELIGNPQFKIDNNGLKSPQLIGYRFVSPTITEWFENNYTDTVWESVVSASLTIKNVTTGQVITTITNLNERFDLVIGSPYVYEITYFLYVSRAGGFQSSYFKDIFTLNVINQFEEKPNKTITDAVNELLATIETLRESETPRFVFNSEQAIKYAEVDAPEFTLTGTLWEALKQIGGYIHAIPRLKGNEVYFDELGSNEKVSQDLSDYVTNTERFDIEQYASSIDSTVQNFVNLDSVEEGSITAPYINGLKTPRTDSGVVTLTEDNLFIQTKEPIEQIVKVEIGYLSDGTYVGDITPYVYESAEYDTLSSYIDQYPYAKAYAIKYTIGQKNITGLNFKRENAIGTVFEKYAIKNIISKVTGKSIGIIDALFDNENMLKLQFRVTYIPMVSARVKQWKPQRKDATFPSVLSYNQSAQKISSRAYGENMKGAIARLGNPEVTKVYIFDDLSMIPKVGQLFDDDYYISVVKCEYYKDFVRCELGLSKDFNKLNEYVGIKSEVRFYEISEKQATQRFINYEDFCVVGDEELSAIGSLITNEGISKFGNSFTTDITKDTIPVNVVKAKGDDNTEVALAVTSYAVGNSNVFTFHYDDNYSAGEEVTQNAGTTIQNQVQYTDVYGEIEALELDFGKITDTINNYNTAVTKGNSVPRTTNISNFTSWFSTNGDKIVIKKDNREIPVFTYQLNYIANRETIIIGSGLARYSPFATSQNQTFKFCILKDRIPKFAKTISADNIKTETNLLSENVSISGNVVKIGNLTSTTNGSAWAICQGDELIVGENIDIEANQQFETLVSFSFTRNLNQVSVFDANGGLFNTTSTVVINQEKGQTYNLPENEPTKQYCTFRGYYLQKYYDDVAVEETLKVDENTRVETDKSNIIYAYWHDNRRIQKVNYTDAGINNLTNNATNYISLRGVKPTETVKIAGVDRKVNDKIWRITLYWTYNNIEYEQEVNADGWDVIDTNNGERQLLGNGCGFAIGLDGTTLDWNAEGRVAVGENGTIIIDVENENTITVEVASLSNNSYFTGIKFTRIEQYEYKI